MIRGRWRLVHAGCGNGLEPRDDRAERWALAKVMRPHLLDEHDEIRGGFLQLVGNGRARAVDVPHHVRALILDVADVSHRKAKEHEGIRERVLRGEWIEARAQ